MELPPLITRLPDPGQDFLERSTLEALVNGTIAGHPIQNPLPVGSMGVHVGNHQRRDRIPNLFRTHSLHQRAGKMIGQAHQMIFAIHLATKQLGVKQHLLKRANVVVQFLHQLLEKTEQVRVGDECVIGQIIDRLEQALTKSPLPEPINDHPRETRILR